MEAIQYIGLDKLDDAERQLLDKLSAEYYEKIARELKNITSITVHVKVHFKGGKKHYAINTKAIAPTRMHEADLAQDWDFARTLHKSFKNLEREITHSQKSDSHPNIPRKKRLFL